MNSEFDIVVAGSFAYVAAGALPWPEGAQLPGPPFRSRLRC